MRMNTIASNYKQNKAKITDNYSLRYNENNINAILSSRNDF